MNERKILHNGHAHTDERIASLIRIARNFCDTWEENPNHRMLPSLGYHFNKIANSLTPDDKVRAQDELRREGYAVPLSALSYHPSLK